MRMGWVGRGGSYLGVWLRRAGSVTCLIRILPMAMLFVRPLSHTWQRPCATLHTQVGTMAIRWLSVRTVLIHRKRRV